MVLACAFPIFLLRDSGDARIRSAHFDPGGQVRDVFIRQLLVLGRHLEIGIRIANCFNQKTLFRIAGDNSWRGIAAFEQTFFGVQQQTAFDLLGLLAMAFVTVINQDGTDFGFEELGLRGR